VDDEATDVLMRRFYERLLGKSQGDVATALQGAMVSMLRDSYDVGQWAAFTVYGLAVHADNKQPDCQAEDHAGAANGDESDEEMRLAIAMSLEGSIRSI
jgi:hypothetical protein